jgi:hypothetical protein
MDTTIHCPRCDQEIDAEGPTCPACGHIHQGELQCRRHPDRTAVGACVVCGDVLCDECDAANDMHHACADHGAIPVIEGWAQIYTTSDEMEADLIKGNLQSEGVDAAVLSQKDSSFNVEMGDLSPIRVLVPAYAWSDAMVVLRQHMDGSGEVLFACPSCGERFEAGDEKCGNCGTPLPTPAA